MLSAAGWLYAKIIKLRNTLYDKGIFESHDLGARTISIGNITTGGTGKTPLVAYVAEILAARGEKVCILTRGYGRKDPGKRVLVSDGLEILAQPAIAGDEPVELARKLIGKSIVISDADRLSAAEWAKRKFGVTAFVLDDGFQHRKLRRDLDIVCIDATNPFGGRKLLPAGRLREPMSNITRADAVVITRANLVTSDKISNLKSDISNLNEEAEIFEASNRITRVTPLAEFGRPGHTADGSSAWGRVREHVKVFEEGEICVSAFCALGNPDSLFRQLRGEFEKPGNEDLDLSMTRAFPDHHYFSQSDISALELQARDCRISAFLTTAKDAEKMLGLNFSIPCFVVEIGVDLDDPNAFAVML